MGFLYQITTLLSRFAYFITRPFQAMGIQRLFSPFRQLRFGMRAFTGVPRYMLRSLSMPLSRLGFRSPRLKEMWQDMADARREREYERAQGDDDEGVFRRREKAEFSQIHLIQVRNQQRTVIHIGTTIGRSRSEVVLQGMGHLPVQLRFSQVNPKKNPGPIRVEYPAGRARVVVDGEEIAELSDAAYIDRGSALLIDDQAYEIELYAWNNLPSITRMNAAWMTVSGPVRGYNQDAIGIYQHPAAYFFAVADGVGGGDAGELISEYTIQYMLSVFHLNVKYDFDWFDVYRRAVQIINAEVRRFAARSDYISGTTLTAVVVQGWEAYVIHLGDSRLYHLSGKRLRRVTTDHLRVVEQDTGGRGQGVARRVLTKAIGKEDTVEPDCFVLSIQPGDKLLLCSDGLDEVKEEEMAALLEKERISDMPRKLIDLANERFNSDNISVIALSARPHVSRDTWRAESGERVFANYDSRWRLKLRPAKEYQTQHPIYARPGCWVLLLLIVALFLGYQVLRNRDAAAVLEPAQMTATAVFRQAEQAGQGGQAAPGDLSATPTFTREPSPTPLPTATALPPTPVIPTRTPQPSPTSTLAPPPTSTLGSASSQRNSDTLDDSAAIEFSQMELPL